MNTLKNLSLIAILTIAVNYPAFSTEVAQKGSIKQHSFGGQLAAGNIEYKNINNNGDGVVQLYGFYNYALNQNFAIELGLNIGTDIDNWQCYET